MPTTNIKITATDKSKNAFTSAKRNVDALKGSVSLLKGALLGYISIAGTKALVNVTQQMRDQADTIGKMSDRLKITTKDLQKFRYVGELSGESIEGMDNNFVKFVRNVGDARIGIKTLTDEFERLEIDLKNQDGSWKNHGAIIMEVADRYQKMEDPARKLSSAMTLFGRGGRVMVNMLSQGTTGFKKYGDQIERAGGIIGNDLVRSSEEANDRLTFMEKVWNALTSRALKPANKAILDITDSFMEWKGIDPTEDMSLRRLREVLAEVETALSKAGTKQRAWAENINVTEQVRDREVKSIGKVILELQREMNVIEARIKNKKAEAIANQNAIKHSEKRAVKELENSRKIESQDSRTSHMRVQNTVKSLNQIEAEEKAHTQKQADLRAQIIAFRRTEEEQVTADIMFEHNRRLEIIKEYLTSRGIAHNENNMLLVQNRKQTAEKLEAIDQAKRDSAIETSKDMIVAMGSANKSWFQANKALAISETLMATYQAATKALTIPPPWVGMAYAGTITGLGLANVNRIRQQKYEPRAIGGNVNAGQTYLVGEQGRELFTPNQSGHITPNHELGTTVNFNITTNDAQGFDDLLQDRRGMIVSMINRASNENGRGNLI